MSGTRAKIMAATREILESKGAGAVSMRSIAAACGISPMTPYWHFPSREALLEAVCAVAFDEVAEQWRGRERAAEPLADLVAIADLFIDFALARPRLYDYMFTAPRPGARQFPGDFAAGKSPTVNLIVEALTDGMRCGVLRDDDPVGLALTLAAQLHGLVALRHGGRIGIPDDAFRALCHDSLRRIFDGISK
ncbi:TetR/AcrR family transcriptional regulator [Dactylosporangium sp. CA-233914]|uniref:TetR/AcrR family transcriptional regulator n=1 Tax=Dactylosporangium sp. CA-233914 TaxID=3239934 RepID=UPI003D8F8EBD